MEQIAGILITGIVFLTVYKIVELGVTQKNRKHLIDKMSELSSEELQSNLSLLNVYPKEKARGNSFSTLRWGVLALSAGLGWFLGELTYAFTPMHHDSAVISFTAICAGIALIVVFFIERNTIQEEKNKGQK